MCALFVLGKQPWFLQKQIQTATKIPFFQDEQPQLEYIYLIHYCNNIIITARSGKFLKDWDGIFLYLYYIVLRFGPTLCFPYRLFFLSNFSADILQNFSVIWTKKHWEREPLLMSGLGYDLLN